MDKDKEAKIEAVLCAFGKKCKNNCNGGGVFLEDLKALTGKVIKKIKEILNEKQ